MIMHSVTITVNDYHWLPYHYHDKVRKHFNKNPHISEVNLHLMPDEYYEYLHRSGMYPTSSHTHHPPAATNEWNLTPPSMRQHEYQEQINETRRQFEQQQQQLREIEEADKRRKAIEAEKSEVIEITVEKEVKLNIDLIEL